MNTLAPHHEHPVIWALTNVVGLSRREIAERAGLSPSMLRHLIFGHTPKLSSLSVLRKLLQRSVDEMWATSPGSKGQPVVIRNYYRAVAAIVAHVMDETRPTFRPVETDLSTAILANLGTAGERPSIVVARVKVSEGARPFSIRRAARRMGVRLGVDAKNRPIWLPPRDLARISAPTLKPVRTPPNSPTSRLLRNRLVTILERGPQSAKAVVAQLRAYGHSRPSIYRGARDACVVRVHEGFGPTRTTTWSMP